MQGRIYMFIFFKNQVFNYTNTSIRMLLAGSTPGCGKSACLQPQGLCYPLLSRAHGWWRERAGLSKPASHCTLRVNRNFETFRNFSHVLLARIVHLPVPEPVSIALRWTGSLLEWGRFSKLCCCWSKKEGWNGCSGLNPMCTINSFMTLLLLLSIS